MSGRTANTVPPNVAPTSSGNTLAESIREYIMAASAYLGKRERRKRPRLAIPYIFQLTPIDDHGNLLENETTAVVGRDLSVTGISFSFDEEPTFTRALISLDHPAIGRFAVVVKLVWSRRTLIGLFETGCQLLGTVDDHTVCCDGDSI